MMDLDQTTEAVTGVVRSAPILTALLVTAAFTALGRWTRGVSFSGAIAGGAVCFVLYLSAGPGAFAALVSVFILTWIATRLGYPRKRRQGTAEKPDGRTARQVLANLAVAAACTAISALTSEKAAFLLAASAALAEAAADTVSSELGQIRSETARLITTWEKVPAGTDGGISLAGTLAGVIAAAAVSLVCVWTGLMPFKWLGVSLTAAIAGMIADSYLGAALERQGLLNNESVNFIGTVIAAGMAFFFSRL
jgi:uncharacterized protein (TIGR00297 family)